MDSKEYLEQISAGVGPGKSAKKGGFFSSTIFKVILGGVVLFALIIGVGAALGGSKGPDTKDQALELNLYIESTMGAISNYQTKLKSSILRSHSASLNSVLSNTTRDVSSYLETAYGKSKAKATKAMKEAEKLHADGLDADLFQAKINGILDRIYAHKMAYEISIIMSKETGLRERINDSGFKGALDSSYSSLTNLYEQFNTFSETK